MTQRITREPTAVIVRGDETFAFHAVQFGRARPVPVFRVAGAAEMPVGRVAG